MRSHSNTSDFNQNLKIISFISQKDMVSSETPSEPGKRPPPEIHSITYQLNDPNNPPESLEIDERFVFLKDLPLLNINAGRHFIRSMEFDEHLSQRSLYWWNHKNCIKKIFGVFLDKVDRF